VDRSTEVAEKINSTLTQIEREFCANPHVSVICAAFMLYISHQTPEETDLGAILSANKVSAKLAETILDRIGEHWSRYLPLLTAFTRTDLETFFKYSANEAYWGGRGSSCSSSNPIADLIVRLLEIGPSQTVCDLGCAAGDFLVKAYEAVRVANEKSVCAGIELDSGLAALAAIRMYREGLDVSIRNDSVFDAKHSKVKFDKVFCDAPFCVKGLAQDREVREFMAAAYPDFPELNMNMTGEWLFAARAIAAMKKGGRAAVVMSPSALFDGRNEPYRRYFVQRNLIEAVILLPPNLFSHTAISAYIVLFSEGNEGVRMVRANKLCYANRRKNILASCHVETIANCLDRLSMSDEGSKTGAIPSARGGLEKYRVLVEKDRILPEGCDLSVNRFFKGPEPNGETVSLGSVVLTAKRGFTISSSDLDKYAVDEKTMATCRYLGPGDISDGVVASKVLSLSKFPEGADAYAAKNGDLVVTRVMASSADFKVAVIETEEGGTLLPNGNLFVFSVDTEKTDPYFVKAWIDSKPAQAILSSFANGSAVRTLSWKNFENLPLPRLPLERQREIGRHCREAVKRYAELRDELATAKHALKTLFATDAPDCIPEAEDEI